MYRYFFLSKEPDKPIRPISRKPVSTELFNHLFCTLNQWRCSYISSVYSGWRQKEKCLLSSWIMPNMWCQWAQHCCDRLGRRSDREAQGEKKTQTSALITLHSGKNTQPRSLNPKTLMHTLWTCARNKMNYCFTAQWATSNWKPPPVAQLWQSSKQINVCHNKTNYSKCGNFLYLQSRTNFIFINLIRLMLHGLN